MKDIIQYLSECATHERLSQFNRVLENRTRFITLVLEDLYQPHNASAVFRSCDCFGIQNVHIIERRNRCDVNKEIDMGSSQWLTLIKHRLNKPNSLPVIKDLKKKGYRIVATTPHYEGYTPDSFPLEDGKSAIFFGTELTGLSKEVLDNADCYLKIPMYGFTESFNISVSAALILNTLVNRLRRTNIQWNLSDEEKDDLLYLWLKKSIKRSDLIIKRFRENIISGE